MASSSQTPRNATATILGAAAAITISKTTTLLPPIGLVNDDFKEKEDDRGSEAKECGEEADNDDDDDDNEEVVGVDDAVSEHAKYVPPHFRRFFPGFALPGVELLPSPAGAAAEAAEALARAETPDTPPRTAPGNHSSASSSSWASSSSSMSLFASHDGGQSSSSSPPAAAAAAGFAKQPYGFDGFPDLTDPASINSFMATLPSSS